MTAPQSTATPSAPPAAKPNATGAVPPRQGGAGVAARHAGAPVQRFEDLLLAAKPGARVPDGTPGTDVSRDEVNRPGLERGESPAGHRPARLAPDLAPGDARRTGRPAGEEASSRSGRPFAPSSPRAAERPQGLPIADETDPYRVADMVSDTASRAGDVGRIAELVGIVPDVTGQAAPQAGSSPGSSGDSFARPAAHVLHTLRREPVQMAPVSDASHGGDPVPMDLRTSRMAATIARIETHFAPVQPPALASTDRKGESGRADAPGLFDQIRAVLDAGPDRGGLEARTTATAPAPAAAAQTAVRILELALQPAALGSLTVTLRLTGNGTLKVAVTASERDTAAALEEDAEQLASVIAGAGYSVENITVTYAGRS